MNFYKKTILWSGWVAFAISAIVYILTMEPSASLWDCSEFIATSYKMEVGHPPGAPLFMMINRIFSIFAPSPSQVAMMVNLGSGIASALTIAFLFWTIAHLGRRLIGKDALSITKGETMAVAGAAFVGSLAYAFTDTFWFSAVEGEVYAQSSLFTAMVFWAILKWENEAETPYANRWLVLVAYLMGLSIGVHLLNLLAIPAIVFVYYYRFNPTRSRLGWWKAFALSVVILAVALYVIIPMSVSFGAWCDRVFVNTFSLPVNSGLATSFIALLAALGYGIWRTYKKGKVVLNTILLCVSMMLFGYGSYATVIVRAQANPPMNSNNPDDPYALLSFLNREQYGNRPLVSGEYYSSVPIDAIYETSYVYNDSTKKYDKKENLTNYVYDSKTTTFFPRMYSSSHAESYQNWAMVKGKNVNVNGKMVKVPTFAENLRYFVNYQLNFMYWRYFLWNFVGKQNDIQSQGDMLYGNWISGIPFIDELYVGPQDNLPDKLKNHPARNTYFFLPFILGMIGLCFQLSKDKNNFTVVFWLFFMTGIAIILYLNQPPLQPRERDYAFAGSFYAFTIWIGLGTLWLYDLLLSKVKLNQTKAAILSTVACLSVPTILIAQNWDDHDRSGRYVARDMGYNYLESALPNSIIMPYGDNDTFPLWYNQEVEGVRTDVRVMNLSYLDADWYIEQMRYKSYESEPVALTIPQSFYNENGALSVQPIFSNALTGKQLIDFITKDSQIKRQLRQRYGQDDIIPTKQLKIPVNKANAIKSGIIRAEDADKALDTLTIDISERYLTRGKLAILDALISSDWSRPIYVTQPSSISGLGLTDYLQADGFAYRLVPFKTEGGFLDRGRIDTEQLYDNLMKFKFGNIKDPKVNVDHFVEHTINATQSRNIFTRLADKLLVEGDITRAVSLINHLNSELPFSQIGHNYNTAPIIEVLYKSGEKEQADMLLADFAIENMQYLDYFTTLNDNQMARMGSLVSEHLNYLQNIYYLAATYNNGEVMNKIRPYLAALGNK